MKRASVETVAIAATALAMMVGVGPGCTQQDGMESGAELELKLEHADPGTLTVRQGFGDVVSGGLSPLGGEQKGPQTGTFVSFTPVSLKYPLIYIDVDGDDIDGLNPRSLYECAGDLEACTVDLADGAAIEALFQRRISLQWRQGSHPVIKKLRVGTKYVPKDRAEKAAAESTLWTMRVKGTLTIGGTTYYTTTGSEPLTTDSTKYDYASIEQSGSLEEWPLAVPIELGASSNQSVGDGTGTRASISASQSATLRLLVNMKDMAFGGVGPLPRNVGPCFHPSEDGSVRSETQVCLSATAPFPYLGQTRARVEAYNVTFGAGAAREASESRYSFLVAENDVVGMHIREIWGFGANPGGIACGRNQGPAYFRKNADRSLVMGFEANGRRDQNYEGFSSFARAPHSGTCVSAEGEQVPYSAVRF